jgi:hypothetical protein
MVALDLDIEDPLRGCLIPVARSERTLLMRMTAPVHACGKGGDGGGAGRDREAAGAAVVRAAGCACEGRGGAVAAEVGRVAAEGADDTPPAAP